MDPRPRNASPAGERTYRVRIRHASRCFCVSKVDRGAQLRQSSLQPLPRLATSFAPLEHVEVLALMRGRAESVAGADRDERLTTELAWPHGMAVAASAEPGADRATRHTKPLGNCPDG